MTAISEAEAEKFYHNVHLGNKLIGRARVILSKKDITPEEKTELNQISSQLEEIDDWFKRTDK